MLILERPWTRQPQGAVRLANTGLAGSLSFLWTPQLSTTADVLVSRRQAASVAAYSGGPPALSVGIAGVGGRGGSNRAVAFDANTIPTSTEYTLASVIIDDAGRGVIRQTLDSDDDSGGARLFQFGVGATNCIRFIVFNTVGGITQIDGTTATSSTEQSVIVARVKAQTGSVWLNGRKDGEAGVGIPRIFPNYGNARLAVSVLAERAVYFYGFLGLNLLGAFWPRALSDAEIAAVSANPWSLFAPRRIYIPTSTAAATVPTLSSPTYAPGSLTSTGWRPQITAS